MVTPKRAPVKPRVVDLATGDTVLLEDVVNTCSERADRMPIELVGTDGSGKTTALAHLASLSNSDRFGLIDNATATDVKLARSDRLVIYTAAQTLDLTDLRFGLAPWGTDDLIEYLLAAHPQQCASVMGRAAADQQLNLLDGSPRLYRLVADEMANDEKLRGIRAALRCGMDRFTGKEEVFKDAGMYAAAIAGCRYEMVENRRQQLLKDGIDPELIELLRYPFVQILLAADRLASIIKQWPVFGFPSFQLPHDLVHETAEVIKADSDAAKYVLRMMKLGRPECVPMLASILHLMDRSWRPYRRKNANLQGAYLDSAEWNEIDLRRVNLRSVDLSNSDLRGALLDKSRLGDGNFCRCRLDAGRLPCVQANFANFSQATLTGAYLSRGEFEYTHCEQARFDQADASGASFRGAKLRGTSFRGSILTKCDLKDASLDAADLREADLRGANLTRVALRETDLTGANLAGATLCECDLEMVRLPGAQLDGADLTNAWLTGSIMPGGHFRKASLKAAGLADIEWEGADLRDADLRNCAFHLGSSRSGLVGSVYPCHGSKTGFYTDDFGQQLYKAPEEIRRANLCGADLRGAIVDDTDFYLVDLRRAKYDAKQAEHFRRCDAILLDRVA